MAQLSIIIVNYNVKHFIDQCLTSVFKALNNVTAEVFVVDNNSIDGSCELIKTKFPEVILIENKENVGFSKANNQAIKESSGEFVLLLNPDTIVEEDTFKKCIDFMKESPQAGALGVKMVDGSGKFLPESKRGLPTPWVAFYKIFGLARLFPNSKKFGAYHLTYLDKDKTHEIDVLSGAFMFMRRSALDKSGLLDEDYFMYGEDIDLSYRIQKAGFKNFYFPETSIIHYKGESTKKSSVNYVFVFYNAMVIFARKHFGKSKAGWFSLLIKMAIFLRAGISIINRLIKKSIWPLLDIASIYTGMYFLKTYWENNHKWVPGKYPPEYMTIAVPLYIAIWLGFSFIGGVYDRPFKSSKVVRSILIGGLIISAVSNFIDPIRFSKALIILGSVYAIFWLIFSRIFWKSIQSKKLVIEENLTRRVALVGSEHETERVHTFLSSIGQSINVIGTISSSKEIESGNNNTLGKIQDLDKLVRIYNLDELIFCAKNISAAEIMGWMSRLSPLDIDFKIVPDDSNFIIGSNSKNTQGDYYSLEVELNLNKPEKKRQKRLFDVTISFLIILLFPILLFTKRGLKNLKDAFSVLFGKNTWVGISMKEDQIPNLRNVKNAIFSPTNKYDTLDEPTQQRLNLLYAKEYTVQKDLSILLSSL